MCMFVSMTIELLVVKAWFQFNPHIASDCKSKECTESDKIANLTKLLYCSKTENFLPLLLLPMKIVCTVFINMKLTCIHFCSVFKYISMYKCIFHMLYRKARRISVVN